MTVTPIRRKRSPPPPNLEDMEGMEGELVPGRLNGFHPEGSSHYLVDFQVHEIKDLEIVTK